jgi:translation initiation factor 1 (eIF-1/SUI1)
MRTVVIRKNNVNIQGVTGGSVDLKELQKEIKRLPKSGGTILV